jgi:hypothetical protein
VPARVRMGRGHPPGEAAPRGFPLPAPSVRWVPACQRDSGAFCIHGKFIVGCCDGGRIVEGRGAIGDKEVAMTERAATNLPNILLIMTDD